MSESGLYRCNECAQKELLHAPYRECAYCHKSTPSLVQERYKLQLLDPTESQPADMLPWVYFCRAHYKIAKRFHRRCIKDVLWKIIQQKEHDQMMKEAAKRH